MEGRPFFAALCALAACSCARAADAQSLDQSDELEALRALSIEQLANVSVSTVSRWSQSLAQAPAAAYVITRQEILQSGAQTLPEVLRLAPNLFVAQTSASTWVITARGLAGNAEDQAFPNKLLVLIDGRSVYTPLFSGVYWDLQDVLLSDVDRIEVISGPAGTLWGANAVNGVINIITRSASETQGVRMTVAAGGQESAGAVRVGGALGQHASWRAYVRGYHVAATPLADGEDAGDSWGRAQAGWRVDWTPAPRDAVSLHGDVFKGSGEAIGSIGGGNVFARWSHAGDESELQAQGYVSREQRGRDLAGGVPLWVNTYDLDIQQTRTIGRHRLVFGGGLRRTDYSIAYSPTLQFSPTKGTLNLASLFVQDAFALSADVDLIVGVKAEHDPYVGWSGLPNVRLSWTPSDTTLVWASVSRAVRSPTPFDRDVREKVGGLLFLTGDQQFGVEKLTAYEAGLRLQPTSRFSASASLYYNRYDDLRSIELGAPPTYLPLRWDQLIAGHTSGVEAWSQLQITPDWRLSASVDVLRERFHFKPGASGIVGLEQVGDDPKYQAMLKSTVQLAPSLTWYAALRRQGALPGPHVPAYTELDSRLGWHLTSHLEMALMGANLLHRRHQEFPTPQAGPTYRRVMAELLWSF